MPIRALLPVELKRRKIQDVQQVLRELQKFKTILEKQESPQSLGSPTVPECAICLQRILERLQLMQFDVQPKEATETGQIPLFPQLKPSVVDRLALITGSLTAILSSVFRMWYLRRLCLRSGF
ncbi:uncharacterized protein LOC117181756 [Belonocnema kinseyi]|uniref:uncharacterized protein LOC117181756 n=1 Tax=Belonocnema kinseyi TaxID=2817044 RepID=UPI00143D4555|nr:uncharacterized protein LOC117181756 [Belonocnema kinseyi]